MKYFVLLLTLSGACSIVVAQPDINKIINSKEVERIERVLSADDMMGRRSFSAATAQLATRTLTVRVSVL